MTNASMRQAPRTGWSLLAAAAMVGWGGTAAAQDITGAGATFPAPLYAKWADAYNKATGARVNYQSVGSGAGLNQIRAKTVDFGASDMPLKDDQLAKDGLVQFPMVIGGVVPVVNIKGVAPGQMKLTGQLLGEIFLGRISRWNDPKLAAVNPGLKLPDEQISVVHRSDGSGTSFLFTNYLSKTNADWQSTVGEGTAVKWPQGVGGKGNEGVAQYVGRLQYSIGYVEYAYVKQNKMTYTQLKNKEGAFVSPDDSTFKAAASGADWSKTFYQVLTDQPAKDAWPLTGATFIMMQKAPEKPANAANALKFFEWAYANGDKMAAELEYVALPDALKSRIRQQWTEIKDASGKTLAVQ